MRERHAYLYRIYTHCVCYILVYSIRILFVYVHTPTAKLPWMAPFTDVPAFGGILLLLPKGPWPWETSDEQAMRKMPERLEIVEDVFTLTENNENPHWKLNNQTYLELNHTENRTTKHILKHRDDWKKKHILWDHDQNIVMVYFGMVIRTPLGIA